MVILDSVVTRKLKAAAFLFLILLREQDNRILQAENLILQVKLSYFDLPHLALLK